MAYNELEAMIGSHWPNIYLSLYISPFRQSNFDYKYILCQQKLNSIYSNVIIFVILTLFLTLPSQPLLPFPLKLQNFTTPNETLMSVCCVCVQIWHHFHKRDRKYKIEINFCMLFKGYLFSYCLATYFVYERAKLSSISVECTKVKLSLQNNFAFR